MASIPLSVVAPTLEDILGDLHELLVRFLSDRSVKKVESLNEYRKSNSKELEKDVVLSSAEPDDDSLLLSEKAPVLEELDEKVMSALDKFVQRITGYLVEQKEAMDLLLEYHEVAQLTPRKLDDKGYSVGMYISRLKQEVKDREIDLRSNHVVLMNAKRRMKKQNDCYNNVREILIKEIVALKEKLHRQARGELNYEEADADLLALVQYIDSLSLEADSEGEVNDTDSCEKELHASLERLKDQFEREKYRMKLHHQRQLDAIRMEMKESESNHRSKVEALEKEVRSMKKVVYKGEVTETGELLKKHRDEVDMMNERHAKELREIRIDTDRVKQIHVDEIGRLVRDITRLEMHVDEQTLHKIRLERKSEAHELYEKAKSRISHDSVEKDMNVKIAAVEKRMELEKNKISENFRKQIEEMESRWQEEREDALRDHMQELEDVREEESSHVADKEDELREAERMISSLHDDIASLKGKVDNERIAHRKNYIFVGRMLRRTERKSDVDSLDLSFLDDSFEDTTISISDEIERAFQEEVDSGEFDLVTYGKGNELESGPIQGESDSSKRELENAVKLLILERLISSQQNVITEFLKDNLDGDPADLLFQRNMGSSKLEQLRRDVMDDLGVADPLQYESVVMTDIEESFRRITEPMCKEVLTNGPQIRGDSNSKASDELLLQVQSERVDHERTKHVLGELEEKNCQLEKTIELLNAQISSVSFDIDGESKDIDGAAKSEDIDECRMVNLALRTKIAEDGNLLKRMEAENKELREELSLVQSRLSDSEKGREMAVSDIQPLREKTEELECYVTDLENELTTLRELIQEKDRVPHSTSEKRLDHANASGVDEDVVDLGVSEHDYPEVVSNDDVSEHDYPEVVSNDDVSETQSNKCTGEGQSFLAQKNVSAPDEEYSVGADSDTNRATETVLDTQTPLPPKSDVEGMNDSGLILPQADVRESEKSYSYDSANVAKPSDRKEADNALAVDSPIDLEVRGGCHDSRLLIHSKESAGDVYSRKEYDEVIEKLKISQERVTKLERDMKEKVLDFENMKGKVFDLENAKNAATRSEGNRDDSVLEKHHLENGFAAVGDGSSLSPTLRTDGIVHSSLVEEVECGTHPIWGNVFLRDTATQTHISGPGKNMNAVGSKVSLDIEKMAVASENDHQHEQHTESRKEEVHVQNLHPGGTLLEENGIEREASTIGGTYEQHTESRKEEVHVQNLHPGGTLLEENGTEREASKIGGTSVVEKSRMSTILDASDPTVRKPLLPLSEVDGKTTDESDALVVHEETCESEYRSTEPALGNICPANRVNEHAAPLAVVDESHPVGIQDGEDAVSPSAVHASASEDEQVKHSTTPSVTELPFPPDKSHQQSVPLEKGFVRNMNDERLIHSARGKDKETSVRVNSQDRDVRKPFHSDEGDVLSSHDEQILDPVSERANGTEEDSFVKTTSAKKYSPVDVSESTSERIVSPPTIHIHHSAAPKRGRASNVQRDFSVPRPPVESIESVSKSPRHGLRFLNLSAEFLATCAPERTRIHTAPTTDRSPTFLRGMHKQSARTSGTEEDVNILRQPHDDEISAWIPDEQEYRTRYYANRMKNVDERPATTREHNGRKRINYLPQPLPFMSVTGLRGDRDHRIDVDALVTQRGVAQSSLKTNVPANMESEVGVIVSRSHPIGTQPRGAIQLPYPMSRARVAVPHRQQEEFEEHDSPSGGGKSPPSGGGFVTLPRIHRERKVEAIVDREEGIAGQASHESAAGRRFMDPADALMSARLHSLKHGQQSRNAEIRPPRTEDMAFVDYDGSIIALVPSGDSHHVEATYHRGKR